MSLETLDIDDDPDSQVAISFTASVGATVPREIRFSAWYLTCTLQWAVS